LTSNLSCANPTTANSSTVAITVNQNPAANAGSNVTITQGDSTTLSATGGITYAWSSGGSTENITVSPTSTTTYTVTVTDVNGCTASDSVTVNVQPICTSVYTLSDSSITIAATGGVCNVNLTTGPSCSWTVDAGACIDWVTVNTPGGSGSSQISFRVDTNTLPSLRTCFTTIAGNQFYIVQLPASPTGFHDVYSIRSISIFPNPNSGIFTLRVESSTKQKLKLTLFNALGQVIIMRNMQISSGVSETDFDLSSKAKGIYYMMILSEDNYYYVKVSLE
jgi:type IX secretion system substrate protein